MSRVENWPAELHTFIERRRRMPFKWGFNDCCQFARAGAAAVRGADPAAALALRRYRGCSGAARILRSVGGVEKIPAACGLEEVRVTLAGRGDVVCTDSNGHPALGICVGAQSAFPGKHGLLFIPTLSCRRAWKV